MSAGLKVWLDSGANHTACNTQVLTWDEAGISESEFDALPENEKEVFAKGIAFAFSDWGFVKLD